MTDDHNDVLYWLVDREAIRDLLGRYCVCMDGGDFAEMAALFTEDGTWSGVSGRGAIAAKVAAIVPTPEEGPRRIHFLSNASITVNGVQASAVSNWVVIRQSETGATVGAAGSYLDDLVKQDGRWLFRCRRITEEIPGDLGLKR
jgi:uncharacterized protein (TIGR02246 family)